jgi:hypothetical protein
MMPPLGIVEGRLELSWRSGGVLSHSGGWRAWLKGAQLHALARHVHDGTRGQVDAWDLP